MCEPRGGQAGFGIGHKHEIVLVGDERHADNQRPQIDGHQIERRLDAVRSHHLEKQRLHPAENRVIARFNPAHQPARGNRNIPTPEGGHRSPFVFRVECQFQPLHPGNWHRLSEVITMLFEHRVKNLDGWRCQVVGIMRSRREAVADESNGGVVEDHWFRLSCSVNGISEIIIPQCGDKKQHDFRFVRYKQTRRKPRSWANELHRRSALVPWSMEADETSNRRRKRRLISFYCDCRHTDGIHLV